MCNAEECPGPYQDFRAQQCSKRNSYYTHQNSKHAWLPYEHHDGERRRVLAKEQEPRCLLSQRRPCRWPSPWDGDCASCTEVVGLWKAPELETRVQ